MANERNLQIHTLLNGIGKAGPELTHGLSELGGGKMADGLVSLWKDGQHKGFVKGTTITTLAFTTIIGGYILIKNAIEEHQMKKALEELQSSVAAPTVESASAVSEEANQEAPSTEVLDQKADG